MLDGEAAAFAAQPLGQDRVGQELFDTFSNLRHIAALQ